MIFIVYLIYITISIGLSCNIIKKSINDLYNINIHDFPSYPIIYQDKYTRNNKIQSIGSYDYLINNYGDINVHLTSSNTYSHGNLKITLKDYLLSFNHNKHLLSNESYYLFGNNYHSIFKHLTDLYNDNYPPCKIHKQSCAVTFGLGDQLSGISFHFHSKGYSEVILGKKLWLLYPEQVKQPIGHHPNISMAQWYQTYYLNEIKNSFTLDSCINETCSNNNSSSLHHCVIEPGDILYFPDNWMHATVNLDEYNLFVSVFIDNQLIK